VLGACTAVHDLERLGLLSRRPKLVAVQASGCAPVHKAYASGSTVVEPVVNMGTAAEGIAIAAPMRGSLVLTALRALGGEVVTAPEDGIHAARHALAARGFFVETTSAATFAAFFGRVSAGLDEGVVVLPLCGAGLKSL